MKQPSTPQEIFDYVIPKILKQGGLSKIVNYGKIECVYRKNKDTRCAIGWLIPDSFYRKEFEGKNVEQLIQSSYLKEVPAFSLETQDFLEDLQEAHDSLYSLVNDPALILGDLIRNFRLLAKKYDLASAVLTKVQYEKA